MSKKTIELVPCANCNNENGAPRIVEVKHRRRGLDYVDYHVKCGGCGAILTTGMIIEQGMTRVCGYLSPESAAQVWNAENTKTTL